MSNHMIWFLAMAVMVATVLTVGTLLAAEVIPLHRRSRGGPHGEDRRAGRSPRQDRPEETTREAA